MGDVGWTNLQGAFRGCTNLTTVAGGNVSEVTNMEYMFRNATSATPDVSGWDTSSVTNMAHMFTGAASANPDVSQWDTSSVTNMGYMFVRAASANPDVSRWNISQVVFMPSMFAGATSADPDMSQWDFRVVKDMSDAFDTTTLSTENYSAMLKRIVDTSTQENVTLGGGSSYYNGRAVLARKTLVGRGWTISDQGFDPDLRFTFTWRTTAASQTLTLPLPEGPSGSEHNYDFTVDWGDGSDKSTITAHNDSDRSHTYTNSGTYTVKIAGLVEAWRFHLQSDTFKQRLRTITNLGDVGWKNLNGAFRGCTNLTTVEGGNVSEVTDMSQMFRYATSATPNVANWDTSSVTNMSEMFDRAASAEPDMSQWDFGNVTNMTEMFNGVTLPTSNYSNLLNRIVDTSTQENVTLDGGSSKYDSSATTSRSTLVDDRSWSITDGGLEN